MIELQGVTKRYHGKKALDSVDLTLEPGKIVGLVGENGSGKSTTLKLIAGLNHPTRGRVTVNGHKATRRIADRVAYLSELDDYYPFFTVGGMIDFHASQFPDFDTKKADEMLSFMNLERSSKVKTLSKGNRGRLKIVLTLSRNVPVLLMDEPLSGLDPMVRDSIVKSLISFIDIENQIVLITTHEIKEIEGILDDVIAIKDGHIIGHHNVEDLRFEHGKGIVEWMTEVYQ
ncbi:ABC transporter ATP-binding protein [Salibacterium qingdaonense]|uniref:ABC-2 type transport system ATP-binding protein n=1 Tax=Salibacterium qingdaonense TaxID=266892 RepID=A0A1I4NS36_9BACI|nr:ABC transporter ATP-binding protein [Salibacterium qingdaonense]SFM18246.1 ABC-2 type transport system ATP-binding protein [Salibacterium qingdaonense]